MTKKSIKEIEKMLFNGNSVPYTEIELLKADERKGVQRLIKRYEKQLKEQTVLLQKRKEMSQYEKAARARGAEVIAGVDEVGRGPLAGPVVAAAVILPAECDILGLDDSKSLSEKKRNILYEEIFEKALAVTVGICEPEEIDTHNIYQASRLAMKKAVLKLEQQPDYLLIDAVSIDVAIPQEAIIKGDAKSISIAAASIVAKVTRDRLMKDLASQYPGYGLEKNMGYPTADHLQGLDEGGVTPIHRRSFAPVKNRLNR